MSDQKLVKRPQRAEAQLNRRATQVLPAQKSQVTAKIIALQLFPGDRLSRRSGFIREGGSLFAMPMKKFQQRLPVIPLRVNRRAAVRGQMPKEFPDPLVVCSRLGCCSISHTK